MPLPADQLDQLHRYALSGNGLIGTAAQYLGDLRKCVETGGSCPIKAMGLPAGSSWEKTMDEARAKLVYADPTGGIKSFKETDLEEDARIPGAIFHYEGIMSTVDEDRDLDIVETKSLKLVEKMPLLWQHMHPAPIGVMAKATSQTSKHVAGLFGIIDTELGRDAAKLARAGALRKSIGFLPLDLEPLDPYIDSSGQNQSNGYRIKSAEVFECSLVSVPANANARILRVYEKEFEVVCDIASGGTLESPVAKQWAKSVYDRRTRIFKGASFDSKTLEKAVGDTVTKRLQEFTESLKPQAKAVGPVREKMIDGEDTLVGSFKRTQYQIRRKLRKFMSLSEVDHCNDYFYVAATFTDHAIVCSYDWDSDESTSYRVDYTIDEQGKVTLTGTPKSIEIKYEIVEKAIGPKRLEAWKQKAMRTGGSKSKSADEPQTPAVVTRAESEPNPLLAVLGL